MILVRGQDDKTIENFWPIKTSESENQNFSTQLSRQLENTLERILSSNLSKVWINFIFQFNEKFE